MFSAAVLKELASKGRSALFGRLVKASHYLNRNCPPGAVFDVFETAFEQLRLGKQRHEYIFKSALTQRILLGTHSLRTASMLSEFRVADCKADIVILNGTASAFEIKSERDTLARLERQLGAYRQVFAAVNVVAGERHIQEVIASVPEDVGVYRLSRGLQVSQVREAVRDLNRLNSARIFECMNTREAKLALEGLGVEVPHVPNTRLYAELKVRFSQVEPGAAHEAMVRVLKKTRSLARLSDLVDQLPPSLYALALTTRLSRQEGERLVGAMAVPAEHAVTWG